MLTVKTYLGTSRIHGVGVFAAERISPGARIWEFHPAIDVEFDWRQAVPLPIVATEIALARSFKTSDGKTILSRDNGAFLNHSDDPNTITNDAGLFAARHIEVGDEITENYRRLPPHAAAEFLGPYR